MTVSLATPLLSLHVGRIQALGPEGRPSAIDKEAVAGPLKVTRLGLEGDTQGAPEHHGGPDKALHHYPRDHYARWAAELAQAAALFLPGGFGENISTLGLTEDTVCLGDIFSLGSAVVQVSQGRSPCWKLNARFGIDDMARRVQDSGRTGWYYRVLEEGEAVAGGALALRHRPCPCWPLSRLWRVLNQTPIDREALAELAALEVLAPGWREKAHKRLGGGEGLKQRLGRFFNK